MVFFIASGGKKTEIVKAILDNQKPAENQYPARMVYSKGDLVWFLDAQAAGGLETQQ
jgi:6-phosphogluconolactonase/glucosamine-6-phosphate isomerase/deaminase